MSGKTLYVANINSNTVTPVTTATNTAGKPIKVGSRPREIAITPDSKTVYVVSLNAGTVTPVSAATNTPGTPINVGREPQAIAITPDEKTAYVPRLHFGHRHADCDRYQHAGQANQGRQGSIHDRDHAIACPDR
jgi:YVTN family beta-propeller protein